MIFVTIEPKHHGIVAPSFYSNQSFSQPGHHDMKQHDFVQLTTSQGIYSNLFSYGGQYLVGHHFRTCYGMNYMNYPALRLIAPQIHGVESSSILYLLAPHMARAGLSSALVVDEFDGDTYYDNDDNCGDDNGDGDGIYGSDGGYNYTDVEYDEDGSNDNADATDEVIMRILRQDSLV